MDFLNFLANLFKKQEKPHMIISTGGGGGGGGGFGGGAGGAGGSVQLPPEVTTKNNVSLIVIIILLLGLLFWFGAAIVRLENYHYAVQVGFCSEFSGPENLIQKDKCLNQVQTRTSPIWNLFYGLNIF